MRVQKKALATLPCLLFFASCVTPPPMPPERGTRTAYEPYPEPDYGRETVPASYSQDRYGDRGYEPSYRDDGGRYDPRVDNRGRYSQPPTGRMQVLFGGRGLDDQRFAPADELGVVGFEFSQVPDLGGLGFEFGVQFGYSEEENVTSPAPFVGAADLEVAQAEISAGVRAEFGRGQIRPYIGGGGAFLSTTRTATQGFLESEDDDSTLGAYIHAGVQADLNETVFLGIDYRHMFAGDFEVGGVTYDGDYDQIALVLGFNL